MLRVMICLAAMATITSPALSQGSAGAYRAGMKIAEQRGYSNPVCYARIFANYAREVQNPQNPKVKRYAASTTNAFRSELWQACRISR